MTTERPPISRAGVDRHDRLWQQRAEVLRGAVQRPGMGTGVRVVRGWGWG